MKQKKSIKPLKQLFRYNCTITLPKNAMISYDFPFRWDFAMPWPGKSQVMAGQTKKPSV